MVPQREVSAKQYTETPLEIELATRRKSAKSLRPDRNTSRNAHEPGGRGRSIDRRVPARTCSVLLQERASTDRSPAGGDGELGELEREWRETRAEEAAMGRFE
jgi:hypothetical protein